MEQHEFLMASLAPHWKAWGVKLREIRSGMMLPISALNQGELAKGWKHATGRLTPSAGCARAHHELRDILLASSSLEEFKQKLVGWSQRWLRDGEQSLPLGLRAENV
jgi:hypothetical protein